MVVRVIWIAFDLRRPSFITANDHGYRWSKHRRCSREEQRFTRNVFFGLFDVRNDLLRRLKNAATQAGESERRAHEFNKRAPLNRVIPLLGLWRNLARNKLTKSWRVSDFLKTAPVFLPATRRVSILRSKNVIAH